jgi:hypothetical protein
MKMRIKTSELQGAVLDWAVAKCEGRKPSCYTGIVRATAHPDFPDSPPIFGPELNYSTDWALAGPIIERENINVFMDDEKWAAYASHSLPQNFYGTSKDPDWDDGDEGSPLVAAMRCYVASVLGDEVEVPSELLQS